MAPPVEAFHPSELEDRVQITAKGKRRKGPAVDLEKCQLLEMAQYNCDVRDNKSPDARVVCVPVVRLFRRCADGLTVETTSWE